MRILITGGTGMIGRELGKALHAQGHEIIILTRNHAKARALLPFPAQMVEFNKEEELAPQALAGVEVIFNLAGENIGEKRWGQKRKNSLYNSRIELTKKLVQGVRRQITAGNHHLKKFISVSAIGIYGHQGDEVITESSPEGSDFLAQICHDWEKESQELIIDNIQVINPRIGIVLSSQGGALDRLLPLFSSGIGSAVGSGKQWMSWIHIKDLVSLFTFLIDAKITGPVNAVAPHPVTNLEFSQTLAKVLNKSLLPRVPSFALKLLLGEMSTLVLSSQRVSSQKIEADGFKFQYNEIEEALSDITKNMKDGHEEFIAEQWVPQKPQELFGFFCDEKNLEKMTPESIAFTVLKKSTKEIEKSTLIDYRLSLHGIPFKWKTEITQWNPPHQFVDVQIKGPYHTWHHTHDLIPLSGGTLLRDSVIYKLPLGMIGKLVALQKVKSDVSQIFRFRREYIAREFYN